MDVPWAEEGTLTLRDIYNQAVYIREANMYQPVIEVPAGGIQATVMPEQTRAMETATRAPQGRRSLAGMQQARRTSGQGLPAVRGAFPTRRQSFLPPPESSSESDSETEVIVRRTSI